MRTTNKQSRQRRVEVEIVHLVLEEDKCVRTSSKEYQNSKIMVRL